MGRKGNLWSREELILSLDLYYKLEYKNIQSKTPEIISLAQMTGRSPNSITMRLANFISCDPQLKERGIKGLDGGLAQCQPIWDEFFQNRELLNIEIERLLNNLKNVNISVPEQNNIVNVIDQEIIWNRIILMLANKYITSVALLLK